MSVKIYHWHGTPKTAVCRILAEYAGVEYEFVNTPREQLKSEEFLKIHSLGKVPVIETPEGKLFETSAILSYFARKAP